MEKLFITYEDIISVENLLGAWQEFLKGKRSKRDVQEFGYRLMENILALHRNLAKEAYQHGGYHAFNISDPKPRNIHKASVRDRLVHHAIYRQLYPYFDRIFIHDSYSCRQGKGTHKAIERFTQYARKVSKNHTQTCWVLKCDIRKFFASIDQKILMDILKKCISDEKIIALLSEVVGSFGSGRPKTGLPLGNLTSQLLVNIYMNEFDQFMKHTLRVKQYIRYADDFVVLSTDKAHLEASLPLMQAFLEDKLKLSMHPNKVSIETVASGVDFLGWVHFPDHRVLRTTTKIRMLQKMRQEASENSRSSYQGLLMRGNTWKLQKAIDSSCIPPHF